MTLCNHHKASTLPFPLDEGRFLRPIPSRPMLCRLVDCLAIAILCILAATSYEGLRSRVFEVGAFGIARRVLRSDYHWSYCSWLVDLGRHPVRT